MTDKRLCAAASLCQLLTLFPFAVLCEGVGFGEYVWWHYAAFFACEGAFWILGRLCGAWAAHGAFSRRGKPLAVFASRAAVLVPAGIFALATALMGLSAGLYLYILPACVIAYFGGRRSVDLEYSDVFSRGWFGLYFVAALVASILLWFVPDKSVSGAGTFQLCVVFGVLTAAAAVLANQTNIDTRTRQRSEGRSVLPQGLRGYNAALIAGVCVLIVGLFLFAKPLAELAASGIKALIALLLGLLKSGEQIPQDDPESFESEGHIGITLADNGIYSLLNFLVAAALVLLAVRFRREIWEFIKGLLAPLFREKAAPEPLPFADEVSDLDSERAVSRSRRRREQALLRRYRRETDPAERFRLGYALFLCRLRNTPFAQAEWDTTTVHAQKGELAFRIEHIRRLAAIYDEVRYGERQPSAQELDFEEQLLREIGK